MGVWLFNCFFQHPCFGPIMGFHFGVTEQYTGQAPAHELFISYFVVNSHFAELDSGNVRLPPCCSGSGSIPMTG